MYDLVVAVLRGEFTDDSRRQRAFAVPAERWRRILGFDGCTVQFDRALNRAGLAGEAPPPLRRLLRDATSESLHRALLVHRQLAEVAALAATAGIRVMALKGAARLLGGELPGTRSLADIDLLVAPRDAARLHTLLRRDLGYAIEGEPYPHHLAGLTRPGSLGIEVHVRLTPDALPLDAAIWQDTRHVVAGERSLELPSPTNLVLHTLEHGARVNWTAHYRLRDILDVAALLATDVDHERISAHVSSSECRPAMETTLVAARTLRDPAAAAGKRAWRTVQRVGRVRSTLGSWPRAPRLAERFFRYAGVIAEGSPVTIGRLGLDLGRRLASGAVALALALVAGCESPVAPTPLVVGPFVFASDSGGSWGLYRSADGVVTRLSTPGSDDREPNSVGRRIVFTSRRDGDAEIYGALLNADNTLGAQTRLTSEYGTDAEPALSPSGATIAFTSGRSGAPRVWLMDADGANPRVLDTGSPDFVPEGAARWSPTGDRIAFTSTRTGTSQVYVVPATGGAAVQLSHESRGAFTPSWLPNGTKVVYMSVAGAAQAMSVPASGGDATVFATDSAGIGEVACGPAFCLATTDPSGSDSRIVALSATGRRASVALPRVADDHHPALLAP